MAKNVNNTDISIPDLIAALFFWILTVGWIILLFYLSNENGITSTERSNAAVRFIESIFGEGAVTDIVVRKVAHVVEYSILTVLSFCAVRFTNRISVVKSYAESPVKIIKSDNEMYIAISMWLSLLTAVVDEYHQLFVDGRDGSMKDVVIDSIGIVIVLIIIRIIFSIHLRFIGSKEVRYE